MSADVVILAGESPWAWAVANALRRRFVGVPIMLEDRQSKAFILRRRIRRLGLLTVIGQLGFGLVVKAIRCRFNQQRQTILVGEGLDLTPSA